MTTITGQWKQGHDKVAYVYTVNFIDEKTRYCYETLRFLMTLNGNWQSVIDARDFFKNESYDMTFITRDETGDQVLEILDEVITTTAIPFREDDVKAICDAWVKSYFKGVPLEDILGIDMPH